MRCTKFIPRFNTIQTSCILFAMVVLLFQPLKGMGTEQPPIHIEADRMVSQEQENSVVFLGNVDASQGELLIRTDEMTVYYTQDEQKSSSKGSGEVDKLICRGNVQISQGDWLGTSQRMDYFASDRRVVLSGNAKAWKGQNMVEGKTITYYLDEGRSIVEAPPAGNKGSKGRVKAVIQPDSNK